MRLRVKEVCQSLGINTWYQLQKLYAKHGIDIKSMQLARLWSGNMKMIALHTLDSLVQVLHVPVDELFEYERPRRNVKIAKDLKKAGDKSPHADDTNK